MSTDPAVENLASLLLAAGVLGGDRVVDDPQPLLDGWVRYPVPKIDVLAPRDRVGEGWAPTAVLLEYDLNSLPEQEIVSAYVWREFNALCGRDGAVRPASVRSDGALSIGFSGGYDYADMRLWTDTQYLVGGPRRVLRQQTITTELFRRRDTAPDASRLRDWFLRDGLVRDGRQD